MRAFILDARDLRRCGRRKNRLKLLQPWLDARVNERACRRRRCTKCALMKICIDMNNPPREEYLTTNIYYDSKVVVGEGGGVIEKEEAASASLS